MHCKTDSFVVETDTHFPTDYNLLWDCARKCLVVTEKLVKTGKLSGWRKTKHWRQALKGLMRAVGKQTSTGGKNKEERVEKAAGDYLAKSRALSKKCTR